VKQKFLVYGTGEQMYATPTAEKWLFPQIVEAIDKNRSAAFFIAERGMFLTVCPDRDRGWVRFEGSSGGEEIEDFVRCASTLDIHSRTSDYKNPRYMEAFLGDMFRTIRLLFEKKYEPAPTPGPSVVLEFPTRPVDKPAAGK
jgi:hypothetical protein